MVLLRSYKLHFHHIALFQSYLMMAVIEIKPAKLSFPHLPPWYQGFDMAGTKMSARAQKARARVARWAMIVRSGKIWYDGKIWTYWSRVRSSSANIGLASNGKILLPQGNH